MKLYTGEVISVGSFIVNEQLEGAGGAQRISSVSLWKWLCLSCQVNPCQTPSGGGPGGLFEWNGLSDV